MDGNGRWAEEHGYHRSRGHREGAHRVDEIVTECVQLGIRYLTFYAFSTENWNRPSLEVNLLWRLLIHQLKVMDKKLVRNKVKMTSLGQIDRLPLSVQAELRRVTHMTSLFTPSLELSLCLSYGGRQEIVDASRKLAQRVLNQELLPEDIDEKVFRSVLYAPHIPNPDLLIRTGGEMRVSNFLLWQIAYSEIYVTPTYWPEFSTKHLESALQDFSSRVRRFGMTGAQLNKRGSSSCGHESLQA